MDLKVGEVHPKLPAALPEHDIESRKRKLARTSNDLSLYEPKTKVQVTTNDKFKVTLDTSNYQPDGVIVKVVDDKQLAVSAKHEAKGNDFYEFHEMYRSFELPKGVDLNTISSRMDSKGQLTIEVNMVSLKDAVTEKIISGERPKELIADNPEEET